jgi:pyruvate dehydrogenase E1 component alpha subunit
MTRIRDRFGAALPTLLVGLCAGLTAVVGSYAAAGFTPAFVLSPITAWLTATIPNAVTNTVIETLGSLGQQLNLATAVALTVTAVGALAVAALVVGRRLRNRALPVVLTGVGTWGFVAVATGEPLLALGAALPPAVVVLVAVAAPSLTATRPVDSRRRQLLAGSLSLVGFALGGYAVGQRRTPTLGGESLDPTDRRERLLAAAEAQSFSLEGAEPLVSENFYTVDVANVDPTLDESDWIFPSYREHAASTVRGLPLEQTILYWMGNANGMDTPEDVNVFPIAVPIATQILHAVGMAWASRLKGRSDEAFVAYFGDGATSEGDFHEAMNFAGVFDTPTVFFCNNNQWAISVPRKRQTASETLAQKATAYGFEGVQVDGMDPLAVYSVTRQAIEKAKDPDSEELRPTLIEAVQYRFGAHTTADDPSVYRDDAEVDDWRTKDPIARLEAFCRDRGLLDDETVKQISEAVRSRVTEAIEAAESTVRPGPEELFDRAYATPTPELERQYAALEALRERYGDEVFLQ